VGKLGPRNITQDLGIEEKHRPLVTTLIEGYFAKKFGEVPDVKSIGNTRYGIKNSFDFVISFPSGRISNFDVEGKVRPEKDYGDFIAEYQSSGPKIKTFAGWFWKSKAQYLFYVVIPKKVYYVMKFSYLHAVLNKKLWSYPSGFSQNKDYKTFFKKVPWKDLPEAERFEF